VCSVAGPRCLVFEKLEATRLVVWLVSPELLVLNACCL
jgi:hypothetical protein